MARTLHDWMERKRLTDADVSARLNGSLSRSQVNRIRRGVSVPPPETARALSELTGIPAGDFAMGKAGLSSHQTREAA